MTGATRPRRWSSPGAGWACSAWPTGPTTAASGADVLLVDEPTAELDPDNRGRVLGLLRDAADRGAALVVATHDSDVVDACDRVVRLAAGRPVG